MEHSESSHASGRPIVPHLHGISWSNFQPHGPPRLEEGTPITIDLASMGGTAPNSESPVYPDQSEASACAYAHVKGSPGGRVTFRLERRSDARRYEADSSYSSTVHVHVVTSMAKKPAMRDSAKQSNWLPALRKGPSKAPKQENVGLLARIAQASFRKNSAAAAMFEREHSVLLLSCVQCRENLGVRVSARH